MTVFRATAATTLSPVVDVCERYETLAFSTSNGNDFFRRKRTTPSASCGFAGSVSKSKSATRTAVSGNTAITSRDRPLTLPSVSRIASRTLERSRKLFSIRSGTTLPGASSPAAQVSMASPPSDTRPASTRSAAISQASLGLALDPIFDTNPCLLVERASTSYCNIPESTEAIGRKDLAIPTADARRLRVAPLAVALDEGDLIDLFQRGQSESHLVEGGFTQEPHALFARRPTNLGGRLLQQNHFANPVTQI